MDKQGVVMLALSGVGLVWYTLATAPERVAAVPPATRSASRISSCERPYEERIVVAQREQLAARAELNTIKNQGGRMTDSAAWGRWLQADGTEDLARAEQRLACR